MALYSQLFYDNNLVCQTPQVVREEMLGWEELRKKRYGRGRKRKRVEEGEKGKEEEDGVVPILFHHVNGKEKRERDSLSWYNPAEINWVLEFLRSLIMGKGVEKVIGRMWG